MELPMPSLILKRRSQRWQVHLSIKVRFWWSINLFSIPWKIVYKISHTRDMCTRRLCRLLIIRHISFQVSLVSVNVVDLLASWQGPWGRGFDPRRPPQEVAREHPSFPLVLLVLPVVNLLNLLLKDPQRRHKKLLVLQVQKYPLPFLLLQKYLI